MKKRKIWGLGFYKQSGKKTAYPTAGRPGRSTGGNREHSVSVGRPPGRPASGKKIYFIPGYIGRLDQSTGPYARPNRSTGRSTV